MCAVTNTCKSKNSDIPTYKYKRAHKKMTANYKRTSRTIGSVNKISVPYTFQSPLNRLGFPFGQIIPNKIREITLHV